MRLPGVLVGDAGQACEAIDVARILGCLDRLFSKVEAHRCITILRTQRSHAYFGGHTNQRLWGRTVWVVRGLRRALEGFLGVRLFLVGGLVVQQLQGIPIGGPLSGSILHAVLSDLEYQMGARYPGRRSTILTG
eukprot:8299973-Pyramimonas_sp.AAC.2